MDNGVTCFTMRGGNCAAEVDDGLKASSRCDAIFRWFAFIAVSIFSLLFFPIAFADVNSATITASPSLINEGESSVFSVTLTTDISIPHDATVVVEATGSAVLGTDYVIPGYPQTPITLTFTNFLTATQAITVQALQGQASAPGPRTITFTITACSWAADLTNSPGSCPTGSSATVTIAGAVPTPVATIEATDPTASTQGPDPGELTVRLSEPAPSPGITVSYSANGTAAPNQDYQALTGSVFIPQGQSSAAIRIEPTAGTSAGDKTVVVTLLPSPTSTYALGQPSSATVTIQAATLSVSALSGEGQIALPGVALQPFVVKATSNGTPLAGAPILWTLVTGQGTLSSGRTLTDSQGQASTTLTPSGDGAFVVRAQIEGTDQSVTFTASFNPLATLPGLTGPQRSMATTLDILCPKLAGTARQRALTIGEQDLLNQCQALMSSSVSNPSAAVQGVAALTPEQASVPRKLATQIAGAQIDNIVTRLMALRRGVRGISLRNLTVNTSGEGVDGNAIEGMTKQLNGTGGGASADDGYEFERLGVFINGNIDWGSKGRSANEDGFDFNTQGITAGVDYRFMEGLVLGIALGYGNTDANIDTNGGDVGANAWSGTIYGTYYATDHFYVEGSGMYSRGNYDQTRNISYSLLGPTRQAKADYSGSQYAFMFGAGYDVIHGPGILDFYGRLRYVNVEIDSYREQGASGLDLNIDSQQASSLMSILGVNYTGSISLAKAVLVPQGWFEWLHEYDKGDDAVSGVFVNDPNRIPFALATDSFDTDSFRVGMGVAAQFGQGRSAFITYEARVGLNNYTEQTANIGVRLEF